MTMTMAEIENISKNFGLKGSESWQMKYRKKMLSTAKGKYWEEIKDLAEKKKNRVDELFTLCKDAEEFDLCKEEIEAWYHGKRLLAMKKYFMAEKKRIPTREDMNARRRRND